MSVSTTRDLRRSNKTAILRALLFGGPTSRQALVGTTSLSAGTVGAVVGDLLEEGLVIEDGSQRSAGGRPRTVIRMASERAITVGVDLGERGLRVEAFDLAWRRRSEVFVDLNVRGSNPDDVVEQVVQAVRDVVARAALPGAELLGVGVSVPGVVERTDDAQVHAPGFGWDGVPLGRLLGAAMPGSVLVDNGAKTMGQAELWFGAGSGADDAVVALLGIGVGAAIFTGGRLYRGSSSSAGEWGHTPIVVDGAPCRCGSHGCLEAYIGESAILGEWDRRRGGRLPEPGPDTERLERLFAAAASDAAAAAVVGGPRPQPRGRPRDAHQPVQPAADRPRRIGRAAAHTADARGHPDRDGTLRPSTALRIGRDRAGPPG